MGRRQVQGRRTGMGQGGLLIQFWGRDTGLTAATWWLRHLFTAARGGGSGGAGGRGGRFK